MINARNNYVEILFSFVPRKRWESRWLRVEMLQEKKEEERW